MVTFDEQDWSLSNERQQNQWEAHQKAFGDLIEQQRKAQQAIADLLEREQKRSLKMADEFEARRKAIADQIEQQWNARRKAITDLANGSGTPKRRLSRTRRIQSAGCSDVSPNSVCT